MANFKRVLEKSIRSKKRTREEYETMIAEWTEVGILTPQESLELMELLDEYYPVEE